MVGVGGEKWWGLRWWREKVGLVVAEAMNEWE